MNTGFERKDQKDEWLTPPFIIDELGPFDLDPCAPIIRPWEMADEHYTIEDDGLSKEWFGRVWCNPPYGNKTGLWIEKLAHHGNGTALIFARTETKVWHDHIWPKADAVFFFKGRLKFWSVDGKESGTAGAPSALVAYGDENVSAIIRSNLKGHLVT